MRSRYGIIPVTSTLHCSCCMLQLHAHKYFNSISFSTDAEPCTSCRCSSTNEKFFHTSDFPDKLGFKTISPLFSRNRISMRPQYLVPIFHWDKTPRSTTEYTDECLRIGLLCARQLSRYSSLTCNGKLASFSVASASCRCGVIWIWRYQRHSTACECLWCACSPFTTSSSKTIAVVKFRRIDVFMRGHDIVSEKWDTNGW